MGLSGISGMSGMMGALSGLGVLGLGIGIGMGLGMMLGKLLSGQGQGQGQGMPTPALLQLQMDYAQALHGGAGLKPEVKAMVEFTLGQAGVNPGAVAGLAGGNNYNQGMNTMNQLQGASTKFFGMMGFSFQG